MSMPSDVTPDITEAMEAAPAPPIKPVARRLMDEVTAEQFGLVAAAAVAFLGVAILGPALARIARPKPLSRRLEDRARDLREQAVAAAERARRAGAKAGAQARQAGTDAGARARKQARRLGGGSIWR
jgi:hypothetical protein